MFCDKNFRPSPCSRSVPSPALANLCAYRFDCRLSGLAKSCGRNYTRHANDLVFSGSDAFVRSVGRFAVKAAAIATEEGFQVNHRKTRVMPSSVLQRVAVVVVVSARLNVRRADFDQLKAILHNCVRHGVEGQNRAGHADFRAHLAGRIAHVSTVAPEHGATLRAMFDGIK